MRNAYIVSYDISHPKRLRKVYKTMLGFGDHIQLSVFRCELSDPDLVRMKSKLDKIIHHKEDQVLLIDIGPVKGRADKVIDALGRAYVPRERTPVVV
jgi:CRISPR-associated protein Cas2